MSRACGAQGSCSHYHQLEVGGRLVVGVTSCEGRLDLAGYAPVPNQYTTLFVGADWSTHDARGSTAAGAPPPCTGMLP